MLGDHPDAYPTEEKWSIVQAYKKGGGVAGLNDIIEHDDADDFDDDFNDRQDIGGGDDQHHQFDGSGQDHDVEIDLNNPDDVKIIEDEFRTLYDECEDLRNLYGEALLELEIVEKYQVIDAYHRGGIGAIQELLDVEQHAENY